MMHATVQQPAQSSHARRPGVPVVLCQPGRFHPGYALLGRWLRRRTRDPLQAEALQILVLTGLALGLVLIHALLWAFWYPALQADPTGPVALVIGGGSLGAVVLVIGLGVLGFAPEVVVWGDAAHLHIRQGRRGLRLPYEQVESVAQITPLVYHRHYRRYAATHSFVGRVDGDLLLLRTPQGPVVLGLLPADQDLLQALLEASAAKGEW